MVTVIDPQLAGVSGNMMVGALIDLGAHPERTAEVMEEAASHFGGASVEVSEVKRSGLRATHVDVRADDSLSIGYMEFLKRLERISHPGIDDEMLSMARAVFHTMAQAEATVHGLKLDEVHFHEVGAADAVADVLGAVFAYFDLNLHRDTVYTLPVAVGGGTVSGAHGRMPVPAPATAEILRGFPVTGGPVEAELATPTGAALLVNMVRGYRRFYPSMEIQATGYGAGDMDPDFPNVLRVVRGSEAVHHDTVTLLETNVDHLSGEVLGNLFESLMDAGALDVTLTPVIMKKNRPGQLIRVICRENDHEMILKHLFSETGTLGVRIFPQVHRGVLERRIMEAEVDIKGRRRARFKVGLLGSRVVNARIEYEDARRISLETGVPLRDVMEMAEKQFRDFMKDKDKE
ncbi:nickel pincer cofactor biosynthesis protein LarC [Methanothermobacter sp. THM-2]|uniref:nickel pincer cofactor biosynthesis protein LarC n=1 Tax=Methanothermobacter sp. THM-2 TaxID=2606912 RepID=UPI001365D565|nr:nickel pincer cofactor biosynthesis protein LarC [Methanothermobacter sp. THM-2]QHN07893.1 nickel pincer cofactor biosynthesis protein LarC [Methanothermobacter sp. THM-2]